jgi:hypothetical protein
MDVILFQTYLDKSNTHWCAVLMGMLSIFIGHPTNADFAELYTSN